LLLDHPREHAIDCRARQLARQGRDTGR
jgi:hypothetical protein